MADIIIEIIIRKFFYTTVEFVSGHNLDKSARTWYYALCADVHLDTGLTILTFQACEKYFLREGEQMISLHDPEAERRYFTSMWLWYADLS